MKIRSGFVSNSSSSSFVVVLPSDFKSQIDTMDLSEYQKELEWNDTAEEDVRIQFHNLVREGYLCNDDCYSEYSVISEILTKKDWVVATVEGGPDDGSIEVADVEKIQKVISNILGGSK